jgi:hypothetical protein
MLSASIASRTAILTAVAADVSHAILNRRAICYARAACHAAYASKPAPKGPETSSHLVLHCVSHHKARHRRKRKTRFISSWRSSTSSSHRSLCAFAFDHSTRTAAMRSQYREE